MALVDMTVVEQRYRAVLAVQAGESVVAAALKVGVSRQTLHSWLRRNAESGLGGLVDRSRRPESCPRPPRPAPTPTRTPPPSTLALVRTMADAVAQHLPAQGRTTRNVLTPPTRPPAPTPKGEAGRPADSTRPYPQASHQTGKPSTKIKNAARPRIEVKHPLRRPSTLASMRGPKGLQV